MENLAENMYQKLVPDSFLILLKLPKTTITHKTFLWK